MDHSKRGPANPEVSGSNSSSSSGDSSCGSPGSPSSSPVPTRSQAPPVSSSGNAFANDGSFMEMFKKKMEEEEARRRKTEMQRSGGSATGLGQTSMEKKPPAVTSFVRGLAVVR